MTDADILDAILDREGGYVHDPADAGGETAWGVSKRYHPELWTDGPPTREQASELYRRQYLAPFAEIVPIELRAQATDIAVNCGVLVARTLLNKALHQTKRPAEVQLVIERLRYCIRLVKARPSQVKFLEGWFNRSVEFL